MDGSGVHLASVVVRFDGFSLIFENAIRQWTIPTKGTAPRRISMERERNAGKASQVQKHTRVACAFKVNSFAVLQHVVAVTGGRYEP